MCVREREPHPHLPPFPLPLSTLALPHEQSVSLRSKTRFTAVSVHAYVDPLKFVRYIVMIAKDEQGRKEGESATA